MWGARLPQLMCRHTGESAAALLGSLTSGLVGRALQADAWRLLPVPSAQGVIGTTAVVTYCLRQQPPLLPLSQVRNQTQRCYNYFLEMGILFSMQGTPASGARADPALHIVTRDTSSQAVTPAELGR